MRRPGSGDAPIAVEVETRLPVTQSPDLTAGAPKAVPYARAGSQSPLSHAYAAFTVDSNAAPYFRSTPFVAASSSFSRPISSSGIRLLRTAAITREISPAACAGVWKRTNRFIFSGLSGAWQLL